MVYSIKEIDDFGKEQLHYYIKQGDSFSIYSTPIRDGEVLSSSLIESCVFVLGTLSHKKVLEKNMELLTSATKTTYALSLSSEETSLLSSGQYLYEIRYRLNSGFKDTTNAWKFDVQKEIN